MSWRRSQALAVVGGIAAAVALGTIAGLVREEAFWPIALAVAGASVVPAIGCGLLFVDDGSARLGHPQDTVETRWLHHASYGALTDVAIAAGVTLMVVSIFDLTLSGVAVLFVLVLGIGVDVGLRYLLLSRRDS